ncbi:hypothetical protein AB7C87_22030 [Natrarchaeobius sp. A-rgal3]
MTGEDALYECNDTKQLLAVQSDEGVGASRSGDTGRGARSNSTGETQ